MYINIAGGLSLDEPAADLALCAAIVSSHCNRCVGASWAIMGEVGLAGEVRPIGQVERRVAECYRLGFTDVVIPKGNAHALSAPEGLRVHPVETLLEALYKLGLTAGSAR